MELFYVFWAKIRSCKGKTNMSMNYNETFSPIVEEKEVKHMFEEFIYELWNQL